MATSGRKYGTIVTHITCGLLAPGNCDGLRPPTIGFRPRPEKNGHKIQNCLMSRFRLMPGTTDPCARMTRKMYFGMFSYRAR